MAVSFEPINIFIFLRAVILNPITRISVIGRNNIYRHFKQNNQSKRSFLLFFVRKFSRNADKCCFCPGTDSLQKTGLETCLFNTKYRQNECFNQSQSVLNGPKKSCGHLNLNLAWNSCWIGLFSRQPVFLYEFLSTFTHFKCFLKIDFFVREK